MELEERPSRIIILEEELLGKTKVEIIAHALDQMKIRGVSEAEVLAVIRHPAETGLTAPAGRERVRKFKKPTKAIDVVYEVLEDRIRVITTFPKRFPRQ